MLVIGFQRSSFFALLEVHFKVIIFTPQLLRAVGVLFSPMVSGWAAGGRPGGRAGGRAAGKEFFRAVSRKPQGVGS